MSEYNIYQYGRPTGISINEGGRVLDRGLYTGTSIDERGRILDRGLYTGTSIDERGRILDRGLYTGTSIDEGGRVLDRGLYTGTSIEGWKSGAKKGAATGAIAGTAIGAFPAGTLVVIFIIIASLLGSWENITDGSFSIDDERFYYFWFPFFTMMLFSALSRMTHFNTKLYKNGSKGDIILIKAITNFLILNIIWIIELVFSGLTHGFWIALLEYPCLYFLFSSGLLVFMLPYTIASALAESAFMDETKPKGVVPALLFLLAAVILGLWKAYHVCYGM